MLNIKVGQLVIIVSYHGVQSVEKVTKIGKKYFYTTGNTKGGGPYIKFNRETGAECSDYTNGTAYDSTQSFTRAMQTIRMQKELKDFNWNKCSYEQLVSIKSIIINL